MKDIPDKKRGLARIVAAFFYSLSGLRSAFVNEAAFRQELLLFFVLLPILFFLPVSGYLKSLLFVVNTMVLIVELLNSGIEAVVDMAAPEYHSLAKRAKDMGSAAVLISLVLAAILWVYAFVKAMSGQGV